MRLIACLILISALTSCKKTLDELPFQKLNLPVVTTYRDVIVFSENEFIVCGGKDGPGYIYKTTDGGTTWVPSLSNFENAINSLFFLNADTGFCADSDILIYKTTNGGLNWNLFYATSWPLTVNRQLRDIWFTTDSTGFVCGGKNYGNGVMYHTTNGGDNWNYSEFTHEYRGVCFTDPLHGVVCGYGSLLCTSDGGQSFQLVDNGPHYYTGVCIDPDNNLWMCDFDGNIYQSSSKGISWHKVRKVASWNSGGNHLNCISISANGRVVCGGPDGFITWSDDNGMTWNDRESFSGNDILNIAWIDNYTLIATGNNGGIYKVAL